MKNYDTISYLIQHDARQRCPALDCTKEDNNNCARFYSQLHECNTKWHWPPRSFMPLRNYSLTCSSFSLQITSLCHLYHCDVLSMYAEQPTCTVQICHSLKIAERVVYVHVHTFSCACTLFQSTICTCLKCLNVLQCVGWRWIFRCLAQIYRD